MHAWSTSMLLLLHSTFILSMVKLLLKGEIGVCTLNSHGNYIVDHGKSWKNHGLVFLSPHFFKKSEGDIVIASVHLSVCPSVMLSILLNGWTKFNQIWGVSYSHEWGVQWQILFWPRPLGPWGGVKGQISFNFNYKVNFKDFYTKLYVCSHK